MSTPLKILVRLPNWLGDMVMSSAFVSLLQEEYPEAQIDLICKKGLEFLLAYFPAHNNRYIFDKNEYKSVRGNIRFGKMIKKNQLYDLFYCLPDSLSSAIMGWSTGATQRIGFRKEGRSLLLTKSFKKPENLHRVNEYVALLSAHSKKQHTHVRVQLVAKNAAIKNQLLFNINSEAQSRRLPKEKAISILNSLAQHYEGSILLIGGPKEKDYVDFVYSSIAPSPRIKNIAGKTNLVELAEIMSESEVMVTTDSGPAHLANAFGVHTLVLFGAGNELNTAPFNKENNTIIRLGKLACEPCLNNVCKKYPLPECLLQLQEIEIVQALKKITES